MTKPIGYYTSYTPGDDGLLSDMEEAWGSQFQSLTNVERTWMIAKIAANLNADFCDSGQEDFISSEVERSVEEIRKNVLSWGDQLRLIQALVSQVISS